MNQTLSYKPPHPRLPATGLTGRKGKPYVPHPDLLAAANAALAIEAPLLLTGEAGCGKTDFAFAAASGLGNHPPAGPTTSRLLECYVRSDSRARDLLYHYDALRRFGDAHHGGETGRQLAEDPRNYLQLQPLGEALMSPHLRVVLIDEIDKAPRDLPNDLLRELDQGCFEIPEIPSAKEEPGRPVDAADPQTYRKQMKRHEGWPQPLVIITSNVERQLPDPFLRRCVFYHIEFPSIDALRQILKAHFDNAEEQLIDRVVDIFEALRSVPMLTKKPTTSELLGWVRALRTLYDPAAVLRSLNDFAGGPLPEVKATAQERAQLQWQTLPGHGCLVKLREDQERLFQGG